RPARGRRGNGRPAPTERSAPAPRIAMCAATRAPADRARERQESPQVQGQDLGAICHRRRGLRSGVPRERNAIALGAVHALGIAPNYLVTLEVVGRRSGRTISFPLVMAAVDGERYLVSTLRGGVDWST